MTEENSENKKNIHNNETKKKSKTVFIVLGIILVVFLIGAAIFYFVYQKAKDYQNAQIELTAEQRQAAIANLFSVPEYNAIPDTYKEHIYYFLEYNGFTDGTYFLTKISDRAKNVFAFGDFTSDDNDEDDLAVVFENSDFKSAKLVIFNHKGELLFVEDFDNELPTINSYKVGSKIYMDEIKLVPSPCDGLILKTPYTKRAVVYDKKDKKFNTFYQYSKEEIEAMESEGDYEEEYYEEASATADPVHNEAEFSIQEVN